LTATLGKRQNADGQHIKDAADTQTAEYAYHALGGKQNNPLTSAVNGLLRVEPKGIEPSTSWLQTRRSPKDRKSVV
jgi:hypothetical protein